MDLAPLSDWLKNTIPGIVILGAIGSIFATALLWSIGKFLPRIAKRAFQAMLRKTIVHFVTPSVRQAVQLHFLNTKNKVESFYAFQVMKFALSLFIAACASTSFALSLVAPSETFFRAVVLSPLVIFFLALWYALRCMAIVAIPLFYDVEAQIERAKEEHLANRHKPPDASP